MSGTDTIDKDELVDWLREMRKTLRESRDEAEQDATIAHFQGRINGIQAVLEHVSDERVPPEDWESTDRDTHPN